VLPPEIPHAPGARLDHVGVAVRSLEEAVGFYRDVLGFAPRTPEAADGATIIAMGAGGVDLELLSSADPESPIGKYVARHGPGIHHLCFRVPDLAQALQRCRAAGYRLIDEAPRPGADGRRVAFLHPKATAGILLELSD
jgi:methylmalonyl-CoA/ethylmalonyl-CoA epimerase